MSFASHLAQQALDNLEEIQPEPQEFSITQLRKLKEAEKSIKDFLDSITDEEDE